MSTVRLEIFTVHSAGEGLPIVPVDSTSVGGVSDCYFKLSQKLCIICGKVNELVERKQPSAIVRVACYSSDDGMTPFCPAFSLAF